MIYNPTHFAFVKTRSLAAKVEIALLHDYCYTKFVWLNFARLHSPQPSQPQVRGREASNLHPIYPTGPDGSCVEKLPATACSCSFRLHTLTWIWTRICTHGANNLWKARRPDTSLLIGPCFELNSPVEKKSHFILPICCRAQHTVLDPFSVFPWNMFFLTSLVLFQVSQMPTALNTPAWGCLGTGLFIFWQRG